MSSWQRALICLTAICALALLGPASALAGGGSAGDQQYIDPLSGQTPPSSHHSSGSGTSSAPSPAPVSSTSSSGSATTPIASAGTSTGTATAGTTAAATTSSTRSSSATAAADPAGKTLPFTGFDAWAGAAAGLCLLAGGLLLRRIARRSA